MRDQAGVSAYPASSTAVATSAYGDLGGAGHGQPAAVQVDGDVLDPIRALTSSVTAWTQWPQVIPVTT